MPIATTVRCVSPPAENDLAALFQLGMAHREARRFAEARAAFSRVCALAPNHALGHIGLGSVCFSEGQFAQAGAQYRQALALNPKSAYAYALLGESQIFQGQHASARVSLDRACAIDGGGSYGRLAQHLLNFLQFLPPDVVPE